MTNYTALLHCIVSCTECYSEKRVREDTEGMLYYPGFDQYGSNVHCEWTFLAPDGYVRIIVCFTSILQLCKPL